MGKSAVCLSAVDFVSYLLVIYLKQTHTIDTFPVFKMPFKCSITETQMAPHSLNQT